MLTAKQLNLTPTTLTDRSHDDILELYWTDVYKTGHKSMLPSGSLLMASNLTPRSNKRSNIPDSKGVIVATVQKTVRKMHTDWNRNFFRLNPAVIYQFSQDMTDMLMLNEPFDVTHMIELHKLGYLPIRIKAITEGEYLPYGVPMITITNTAPINGYVADWIVNYLETILSSESWQGPTSATLAFEFKKLGKKWIDKTNSKDSWILEYMFHDFSMRGMGGKSAIINSGLGHAMVSRGSDTLPIIPAARIYYDEKPVCINSVIASEHAIMCTLTGFFLINKDGSWDKIGELEVETFRHLLRKFPTGILSLVSDTWDLWRVITEYCVILKEEILNREGKLVIRPDSGDPVDIICGKFLPNNGWDGECPVTSDYLAVGGDDSPSGKGVIELLWDIFGGTVSDEGYRVLHPKIGAIYGDAITYDRAKRIFERLADKKFAATNIVLGVGSYSYQYVTRDTHGFAQKATYVEMKKFFEVNPDEEDDFKVEGVNIFKDPVTDGGVKKSARGLLRVDKIDGVLTLKQECTHEEESGGELKIVYEDGHFYNQTTLTEIRERINKLL